ncbi:MarR family winged helix-turn-helix transcriptional regulator [Gemmobacter lanyuensis]
MGPLRALMAIGAAGMDVGALRDHLTLDSGLMSRQLRQLEEDGLITVTPDPEDARRRRAACTPAGLAEIAACQQLTRDRAAELHDLLDGDETLLAAMDRVATLLAAHRMRLRLIDPDSAEAAACLRAYYTELSGRFGLPFTPAPTPTPAPCVRRAVPSLWPNMARTGWAASRCAGMGWAGPKSNVSGSRPIIAGWGWAAA